MALLQFVIGVAVWVISFGFFGWVINLWSTIDAALWKPRG
jgi:hypothetical protein